MNPALRRLRPLGLCLLAAVLLHSLVLAMLHLQRQRSKSATALSVVQQADDTPELLRFSRHQAETGTPAIVPLPGFDQLPPPPPIAAAAAPPAGSPKALGQGDFKPRRPGASARASRDGKRGSESRRRPSEARPPMGIGGGQAGASAPVDSPAALLERLRRLALEPGEPRPGPEPPPVVSPSGRPEGPHRGVDLPGRGAGDAAPLLRRPEGAAQQPYQTLWESARPETAAPAGVAALPASFERRSLPLPLARRGGVAFNHGEGVLLGDQLLIFWIQGDQLWLWRGKLTGG